MAKSDQQKTCGICGLGSGEIRHSGLGPVSYLCCDTCINEDAEEIGVICFHLFVEEGDAKSASKGPNAEWWKTKRSFYDGKYIGWEEISSIYEELEPEIKADFESLEEGS
jgi:hypothetical protein